MTGEFVIFVTKILTMKTTKTPYEAPKIEVIAVSFERIVCQSVEDYGDLFIIPNS